MTPEQLLAGLREEVRGRSETVQKKGHDKFVELFLLKGLEPFGVTGEMVLQTEKEMGPTDVAKHVANERKATRVSKPWSEP